MIRITIKNMRKAAMLAAMALLRLTEPRSQAQTHFALLTDTNGNVITPTNFFAQNAGLIVAQLTNAAVVAATNGHAVNLTLDHLQSDGGWLVSDGSGDLIRTNGGAALFDAFHLQASGGGANAAQTWSFGGGEVWDEEHKPDRDHLVNLILNLDQWNAGTDGTTTFFNLAGSAAGLTNINPTSNNLVAQIIPRVFTTNHPTRVVFDGDSITYGYGVYQQESWAYWLGVILSNYFPNVVVSINDAVSGSVIQTVLGRYTNNIQPFKPAGGTNGIYCLWVGVNDFIGASNLTTVELDYSNLLYVVARDGWQVLACVPTPNTGFTPTNYYNYLQFCDWLRQNTNQVSLLVDVAAQFPYVTTNWFEDGVVHPNIPMHQVVAAMAFKEISTRMVGLPPTTSAPNETYGPNGFTVPYGGLTVGGGQTLLNGPTYSSNGYSQIRIMAPNSQTVTFENALGGSTYNNYASWISNHIDGVNPSTLSVVVNNGPNNNVANPVVDFLGNGSSAFHGNISGSGNLNIAGHAYLGDAVMTNYAVVAVANAPGLYFSEPNSTYYSFVSNYVSGTSPSALSWFVNTGSSSTATSHVLDMLGNGNAMFFGNVNVSGTAGVNGLYSTNSIWVYNQYPLIFGGNSSFNYRSYFEQTVTGSSPSVETLYINNGTGSGANAVVDFIGNGNIAFYATASATNGFASYATNTFNYLGAAGATNAGTNAVILVGVTGVSIIQSNTVSGLWFSRGTLTAPTDITLQPHGALLGSSMACVTNIAW
jgi:hypothetical protein